MFGVRSRLHLLERVIALDEYAIYMDTDSIKLRQGYDRKIFDDYNDSVLKKLKYVANQIDIPFERFQPKDTFGVEHPLGVFESETKSGHQYTYDAFITQGAKKYAYELDGKIKITVAGVPKGGAKALKSLDEFRDDLVFPYEMTGKSILMYVDDEQPFEMTTI